MKCHLEENSRLFSILSTLANGYQSGDFEDLFPFLAPDCVMESQWVLTPNVGYEAVVDYFTRKGNAIAKSGAFPACSIIELTGKCHPINNSSVVLNGEKKDNASFGLLYTEGKLCLLMEQTLNGETNGVVVDITIDNERKVKRIDLCMPELFQFRYFDMFVNFLPATDDTENEDAMIRVGEYYYNELYFFLDCAGQDFDEYDDLHIPMNNWVKALSYWEEFANAQTFDEAFEILAGVDYENGTVAHPERAESLGRNGKRLWENRNVNSPMLRGLIEWTNTYKASYNFINTYGW